MNILAIYIRKYLQKNKISTILSTLSLMCASIFFYIVVCLSVNTIIGLQDFTINSFGNYHAVFENVGCVTLSTVGTTSPVERFKR